jgi:hypothetical protein
MQNLGQIVPRECERMFPAAATGPGLAAHDARAPQRRCVRGATRSPGSISSCNPLPAATFPGGNSPLVTSH